MAGKLFVAVKRALERARSRFSRETLLERKDLGIASRSIDHPKRLKTTYSSREMNISVGKLQLGLKLLLNLMHKGDKVTTCL